MATAREVQSPSNAQLHQRTSFIRARTLSHLRANRLRAVLPRPPLRASAYVWQGAVAVVLTGDGTHRLRAVVACPPLPCELNFGSFFFFMIMSAGFKLPRREKINTQRS